MTTTKALCLVALLAACPATAQEAKPTAEAPSAAAKRRWTDAAFGQKAEWYSSAEARALADSVIQYQSPLGGWPRNVDLGTPPVSPEALAEVTASDRANSFDNNGTTQPMEFLALVAHATGDAKYKASFAHGLDYLFTAQYPNGGFPQRYPPRLRKGRDFFAYVTFNNNVMMNVLTVLRGVAAGRAPYDFTSKEQQAKAAAALARGMDCILKTQIKNGDKLIGWCSQYNPETLAPAQGRDFEPPSVSGTESVSIVRFLMDVEKPTPQIIAAVQGAVAWYQSVAIRGMSFKNFTNAEGAKDKHIVPDPAGETLWARFYELGTMRPLFTTHRNVIKYDFSELPHDWRLLDSYAMYGNWPATLLTTDYPAWCAKHKVTPVKSEAPAKKP